MFVPPITLFCSQRFCCQQSSRHWRHLEGAYVRFSLSCRLPPHPLAQATQHEMKKVTSAAQKVFNVRIFSLHPVLFRFSHFLYQDAVAEQNLENAQEAAFRSPSARPRALERSLIIFAGPEATTPLTVIRRSSAEAPAGACRMLSCHNRHFLHPSLWLFSCKMPYPLLLMVIIVLNHSYSSVILQHSICFLIFITTTCSLHFSHHISHSFFPQSVHIHSQR
jgi:hypothetical protein